jgi:GNAT superfamily N-acetyltransferase
MKLSELTKEHQTHFNQAPLFMDVDRPDTREWEDAKVFVAYDKKPIGYIKLTKHAESFVSESDSVINITGAQVLNEYRGKGVAKALLAYSNDWAEKNGYQFLGVDFESFNPSGAGFWNKYFTPYTYSLTRRIDERILTNSNLGYGYKKTGGV